VHNCADVPLHRRPEQSDSRPLHAPPCRRLLPDADVGCPSVAFGGAGAVGCIGAIDAVLTAGSHPPVPNAHRHRHGAEVGGRRAEGAGQRDRGAERHGGERRRPRRQRRGHLRAQHLLHGMVGAKAEQRAFSRDQLQSQQSGHHHLHRRRTADERELVEHRAARRRSDRVRARSPERPLRTEHPRRPRQHHQHEAVHRDVDGGTVTASRYLRSLGRPRRRVGTDCHGQGEPQRIVRGGQARRLHRE
jgi:hypothetical protein